MKQRIFFAGSISTFFCFGSTCLHVTTWPSPPKKKIYSVKIWLPQIFNLRGFPHVNTSLQKVKEKLFRRWNFLGPAPLWLKTPWHRVFKTKTCGRKLNGCLFFWLRFSWSPKKSPMTFPPKPPLFQVCSPWTFGTFGNISEWRNEACWCFRNP